MEIKNYKQWFESLTPEKQKLIKDNKLYLTVGQAFARGRMIAEDEFRDRCNKAINAMAGHKLIG